MTESPARNRIARPGPENDRTQGASHANRLLTQPGHFSSLVNNAVILRREGRYEASRLCYLRALKLRPEDAVVWSNYGNLLCDMFLLDEAREAHQRALSLGGETPGNLYNAGVVPFKNNQPAEAIELFSAVLEQQPDHHNARWNRALSYLQMGDLHRGFKDYEIRLDRPEMQRNFHGIKPWRGESLKGKKILLAREQGFGDMIQFVRFAGVLQAQGAEVYLEAQPRLKRFMFCVNGVDHVLDENHIPAEIDFYARVMSLPGQLDITLDSLAATQTYMDVDKFIARRALPGQQAIKVGLVWASKAGHPSDRSCPLASLIPLLKHMNVDFYSFQKGDAVDDIYRLGLQGMIHDLDDYMTDFYDTACYMKQMDLIISIDSSPLHCAASLGVSTWGLLLHAAEWRWLLERSDSPWYPGMRLYRQTAHCVWDDVIESLLADFDRFIHNKLQA